MRTDARKQLRSQINGQILKTLSLHVAAPLLAAELYRIFQLTQTRGIEHRLSLIERREYFYTYLVRLARKGYIRYQGLRRRKTVFLTPKGVKALQQFDVAGIGQPPPPPSAKGRSPSIAPALRRAIRKASASLLDDRFSVVRKELARAFGKKAVEGCFISYDIPESLHPIRSATSRTFRRLGFLQVNGSFYVGPRESLRAALEAAEDLGILQYCCWGKLQILPP